MGRLQLEYLIDIYQFQKGGILLDLNLEGKRAVVTGASLGIGEAVVKMLSDHGASITFCARNKDGIDSLSKYKS